MCAASEQACNRYFALDETCTRRHPGLFTPNMADPLRLEATCTGGNKEFETYSHKDLNISHKSTFLWIKSWGYRLPQGMPLLCLLSILKVACT